MIKFRIYRRYIFILCLLLITAACDKAPTEPEPGLLVLQQRILLDFSSPFETESIQLIEGNYYEVKFRGEFLYAISNPQSNDTTHYISQSGIYTSIYRQGALIDFYYSFPCGTPLIIKSNFLTADKLSFKLMAAGVYTFKGICSKTETIKFAFENPWDGTDLLNTSGIITVQIYKEEK